MDKHIGLRSTREELGNAPNSSPADLPGHLRKSVVILQPYIPAYRVKFFRELIHRARLIGVDISVAAGQASGNQAQRNDGAIPEFATSLRQREFQVFGRRVTVRSLPAVARHADLIILEQARRNVDTYRLLLPKWSRRKAIALWGHGADHAGSKSRLDYVLRSALTKRADWFFAYTVAGVESVYKQGVVRGRATNVQNSTDTSELRNHLAQLATYSQSADRSSITSTATYVGALDNGKRVDLLIAAACEIRRCFPGFKLVIAGSGPELASVQRAADTYEWLDYVGVVGGEKKARILASADLMMIPGSIGLVAVDALAAGLPIVTTAQNNHGPEFDYLEEGRTVIVSDASVGAYSQAVVSLLKNPPRLATMQQSCRDDGENYSVEKMAQNFLDGIRTFFEAEGTR
ncbi:UNVERIFIED_ORG: glycosyltransferase involved in cell wall biosynthesis [Arthrobacter sp. UYEF2]